MNNYWNTKSRKSDFKKRLILFILKVIFVPPFLMGLMWFILLMDWTV